jgi:hypothetical protein
MDLEAADHQREAGIRRRILLTATWSTPLFIAVAGAWCFFLWDRLAGPEYGSTWFLMVVITIFVILFGVQSVSALRDLVGRPHEETAMVVRKWSKRDSFVFKSYYVRLERKILRGDRDLLEDVRAGDVVEARYYPHSGLITALRKVDVPEEPAPPALDETPREPVKARGTAARPEF